MTLQELKQNWSDMPEFHQLIHETFFNNANNEVSIKQHRDWVENHVWGFGERSFWWMWKLIFDELPTSPKLLEIGCFKGATLSVWKLLNKKSSVYGVTPLSSEGIDWEDDYRQRIFDIHDEFKQSHPVIIEGLSESEECIVAANHAGPYDCVYIDGGHERRHIDNDLTHYAPLVKTGGYLVIDDACCDMKQPWGYFQGIQAVTDGVLAYMANNIDQWEFIGNVVHLRVYQKAA